MVYTADPRRSPSGSTASRRRASCSSRRTARVVVRRDGDEDDSLLDEVPDGRARAAAALRNPNSGEVLVSAAPGWEFVDLAGAQPSRRRQPRLARGGRLGGADAHGRPRAAAGVDHRDQGARSSTTSADSQSRALASPACPPSHSAPSEALRRPHNWIQLAKFGRRRRERLRDQPRRLLARCSARRAHGRRGLVRRRAANNYWWNRHWTFAGQRGSFAYQGMRFFVVSVARVRRQPGAGCSSSSTGSAGGRSSSQAVAIMLVTPLNFLGNKLWSFRR